MTECSLSKKLGNNPADLPIPKKEPINLDKKTKKEQQVYKKDLGNNNHTYPYNHYNHYEQL